VNRQVQPGDGPLEEFRILFLNVWEQLPNRGFFLAVTVLWLALFHFFGNATLGYIKSPSLFGWMYGAYTSEAPGADDDHGLLVPFVVLLILWWKREELVTCRPRLWWPALIALAGATCLHVVGYAVQQPRISIVALFSGLFAITGLAWGPRWLVRSFFPFILFAFMVPLGSLAEVVTTPLRHLVAQIVTLIAHAGIAPDLIREGTQLRDATSTFHYDIAPACSGIRSLVSLILLTAVYGFITFKPAWKRFLMVLLSIPIAVIGNVARISFTVLVAEAAGHDAGAWVEQKFGFVTFGVAIGLVLAMGHWMRDPAPPKRESGGGNGAAGGGATEQNPEGLVKTT
jgi:exosortase